MPAARCIDGGLRGTSSLCHTQEEKAPWLALDFGTQVEVERVVLHNRESNGERLSNAEIRVADQLPLSGQMMFSGGQLFDTFKGPGKSGQVVTLTSSAATGLVGRFVIVQINNSQGARALNLNEVTVWGKTEGIQNIFIAASFPDCN